MCGFMHLCIKMFVQQVYSFRQGSYVESVLNSQMKTNVEIAFGGMGTRVNAKKNLTQKSRSGQKLDFAYTFSV